MKKELKVAVIGFVVCILLGVLMGLSGLHRQRAIESCIAFGNSESYCKSNL